MAKTKNIKVRDLKPSKDAKGGGARSNSAGLAGAGRNSAGLAGASHNSAGRAGASHNSAKSNNQHQNLGGGHHG
jgi:hypothetical protein